jgi:hypothetical protein
MAMAIEPQMGQVVIGAGSPFASPPENRRKLGPG